RPARASSRGGRVLAPRRRTVARWGGFDDCGPGRQWGVAARSARMRRRRGAVLSLVLPAAALALGGCGRSAPGPVDLAADAQVGVAAANPVTVSPLPGTPDASPRSQISFLGG